MVPMYQEIVGPVLTLICVAVAAVSTSALACYPSARRATSADPVAALRAE